VRFDDRFLEEIKSRLRLSDVIGRSVKLRRQGREYVGLSPFSKEKTPSFYVNDEKGFFHDFSSGKHGDLISFLQETERLSFMEAVERLASEAGVALPAHDPRAAEHEKARQGLSEWLELACKWFEAELRRPVGAEARAYLARRGLPESEWARFGLGYSPPGRTALKDYLIAKGAAPRELVDAGLLIAPEDGGAPYDRFRERIIFPITDQRGRVVCSIRELDALRSPCGIDARAIACRIRSFDDAVGSFDPGLPCLSFRSRLLGQCRALGRCQAFEQSPAASCVRSGRPRGGNGNRGWMRTRRHRVEIREKFKE